MQTVKETNKNYSHKIAKLHTWTNEHLYTESKENVQKEEKPVIIDSRTPEIKAKEQYILAYESLFGEIKVRKNKLYRAGKSIEFEHEIRAIEKGRNCIYVLLSSPYGNMTTSNLICISHDMSIIWRAQNIKFRYPGRLNLPFEAIKLVGDFLHASDIYGKTYCIHKDTGSIVCEKVSFQSLQEKLTNKAQ